MKMRELATERHQKLIRYTYGRACRAYQRGEPQRAERWERWLVLLSLQEHMKDWPQRFRWPN